jgi:hypothetical protein
LGNYCNIRISAKESIDYKDLKKHKPLFDKDAQNCKIKGNVPKTGDNINNIRLEASRHLGIKRGNI